MLFALNVLRFCAAALDKLNNSAPTVQRWRKTAVIGSVRQVKRNETTGKEIKGTAKARV